jgi:glycerophosphoryl diester phosphodiesterase
MTSPAAKPRRSLTVIAHRGASGELPEHTMAAYALAIDQGADFIEPDLVATRDGVLVARHDLGLRRSTNIAEHLKYIDRLKPDGRGDVDWFVYDFTYDELCTLRATQPWPGRNQQHNGRLAIPRFEDVLAYAQMRARELGRPIGVYPELKEPAYFAARNLDIGALYFAALQRANVAPACVPIYLQCFDHVRLHQWWLEHATDSIALIDTTMTCDLAKLSSWCCGIGVAKSLLIGTNGNTDLMARAHAAGLLVHAWTFRDDLVGEGFTNVADELRAFIDAGVDGVFCDFPRTPIALLAEQLA